MKVALPSHLIEQMRRHGEATYPEECCGFLVGREAAGESDGVRRIVRVEPMANQVEGPRERRFIIRPEELRRFEKALEGTGEAVVGFYHSHPDHPAVPSLFDQDNAWPWYTYLVISVDHGHADEVGAFELDPEERRFVSVAWTVASGDVADR